MAPVFFLLVFLVLFCKPSFAVDSEEESSDSLIIPFALDAETARWARQVAPHDLSPMRRLRAISKALLDPRQIGMQEAQGHTHTASEAFAHRHANCVGYAALFVGLAREAGVPAFFVLIEDFGPRQRRGSLRVNEGHLAAAYGPADRLRIFDFAGESDGLAEHAVPVTDLTAIALYYSNRGVELMLADRDEEAARWLRRAIDLDPTIAASHINLGVALRRLGDLEGAQRSYEEALRIDPGAHAAYRSLAAILRYEGRVHEADDLMVAAARLREGGALSYLDLARESLEIGDVDEARGFYRKALELSRYPR